MSKFDAVLKTIEENSGIAITQSQQQAGAGIPPKPANNQQAMQQLFQDMVAAGLAKDVKEAQIKLQPLINPQQTQQQKPAPGTSSQPAV
jgi:hypothetical protein